MLKYTAQGGQPHSVKYTLENDVLVVDIDGILEKFDFSEMPNGRAENIIVELLPINPITHAKREDGELEIEVIYWYTKEEISEYEKQIPSDIDIPFGAV